MDPEINPPAGFARHFRPSPLTEPWEPLYSRRDGDVIRIGFVSARPHTNSRGFVHGGMLSALADAAMGLSCGQSLERASLVTVSLALDFLGPARVGQWIEVAPKLNRIGPTLCFAEADLTADGQPCAKAHATFRVVRPN